MERYELRAGARAPGRPWHEIRRHAPGRGELRRASTERCAKRTHTPLADRREAAGEARNASTRPCAARREERTGRGRERSSTCSTGSAASSTLYAEVRAAPTRSAAWRALARRARRALPRPPAVAAARTARATFPGVAVLPYDPALRVLAEVEPAEPSRAQIGSSGARRSRFRALRPARFALGGEQTLELYWLTATAAACSSRSATRRAAGDLRRRPLPARHGQGRRPRQRRRPARARLQLRLQPVVRLRPALGVPARAAGEPARDSGAGAASYALDPSRLQAIFRPDCQAAATLIARTTNGSSCEISFSFLLWRFRAVSRTTNSTKESNEPCLQTFNELGVSEPVIRRSPPPASPSLSASSRS